jgi:hypothetical protein
MLPYAPSALRVALRVVQVCTLQGHMSGVTCVQFRPDCKMLASCDTAGEVRLWVRDYDPPGSRPGSRGLEEHAQEGGWGGESGRGSGDVGGDGSRANSMQSALMSPLRERRRGRGGEGGGGGGGGASAGPLSILRLESPVRASSREDVSAGGANSQEASAGGASSVLSPLVRIDSPLTRRERELAAGTSSRGSRGQTARLGSPASASSCHSSDDAAGASWRGQDTPPRLGTPLDTVRARQRWKALATSYAGVC